MLIRYEDFELIINETAGHLTVEARGPRQITVEPLPLGRDLASVLQEDEQLAQALKQLQHGYSPSRAQMLAIGSLLFRILMPAQIIRAYDRAKGALGEGSQLRLRLNVRPPTLSRLPWELLFDSTQNTFLAMRRAQPLVRVLDNPNPVAKLRIDGPLSVLLVQAQPIDLAPLNLEESKKALQEAFGRRAEIKVLANATPASLRLALQKETFHILHYDGHGFFDEYEQSGFLALENDKQKANPLSGQQLANYLSGTQVRLVVLSACQTAQDSMRQRFVGVAQHLMRSSDLPAVVAMQFAIPDKSAIAFNRGFYGALANGYPVDAALAAGRMAIQEVAGMSKSDWATPLLIMRTTDGRLWEHFIEDEEVTPILSSRNPYVGLQTFQEEDAAWFFGREGLVNLLQQKAQESPFLAILGPSGSGKSSVVLAGLLPALKAGALPGSDKWLYVSIKPTNRPLDTLAAALNKLQGGDLGTLSTLRQALVSNERALLLAADMVRADKANTRLVLVVDQFEELWTLAPTESDARQTFIIEKQTPFIRLLLSAIEEQKKTKDPSLLIILTMRIDFLHRAAETRDLARHIGEHDVIVSPMQPDELHKAIEEPAKKAGGTFEPGLIDELIEQTRGRQGALPLLEYTLQELWRSKLPDGTMTWDDFKKLNGVEGALAAGADSILSKHYDTPEKQKQLRHLLLRLVQPGEGTAVSSQKIGVNATQTSEVSETSEVFPPIIEQVGTAHTRRRVLLKDLVPAGMNLEGIQTLLKPLVDGRLLTTSRDKLEGEQTIGSETIEVSHEALINAWPTFKQWINDADEDLRFQLQLEEAAKEWKSNKEDDDYLWSGLRLANAETWLNRAQPSLNERDKRFLQASRAAQRRNIIIRRAFIGGIIVLLIAFISLSWWSAQQDAENQRELASQEKNAAATARVLAERESQARAEIEKQLIIVQSQVAATKALDELSSNNHEQALLFALISASNNLESYPLATLRAIRQVMDNALIRYTFRGDTNQIKLVAYEPQRQYLLTSNADHSTAHLWDIKNGNLLHSLENTDSVRLVAFDPQGEYMLIGCDDGTVHLWETKTGHRLRTLEHKDSITSVAFDPQGQYVLIGSEDGLAHLWNVETGNLLYALKAGIHPIVSVAFDPEGYLLTGAGYVDNKVIRWHAKTGRLLHTFNPRLTNWVKSVAFGIQRQYVVTGSEDGPARIWAANNYSNDLDLLHTLVGHTGSTTSAAFDPQAQYVLTGGSFDNTARLWDVETGNLLHTLEGHTDLIQSVGFDAQGKHVFTNSSDGTARLWNVKTDLQRYTLSVPGSPLTSYLVAFDPQGQYVMTGGQDYNAHLWNAKTGDLLDTFNHTSMVSSVMFSPKGQYSLIVTGGTNMAILRSTKKSDSKRILHKHTDWITSVAFGPQEQYILTGSNDRTARLWDVNTGDSVRTFEGHTDSITSVAFDPQGQYILTGSKDKTARLWNLNTDEVEILRGHIRSITSVAFGPQGKYALTGSDDGTARLWDVKKGTLLNILAGHKNGITSIAFDPAGKYVLTGSDDGTARLWDINSVAFGKYILSVHVLKGHTSSIRSVAFDPQGKYILTGSDDQTARLWNLETGDLLDILQGHNRSVSSVVFGPNGKQALTGSRDGTARLWILDHALIIAKLTERVCNVLTEEEIHAEMPEWRNWRGCETELEALAEDLAEYNELRGE